MQNMKIKLISDKSYSEASIGITNTIPVTEVDKGKGMLYVL